MGPLSGSCSRRCGCKPGYHLEDSDPRLMIVESDFDNNSIESELEEELKKAIPKPMESDPEEELMEEKPEEEPMELEPKFASSDSDWEPY
ncbi:hypothetical protein NL676_025683 [Syzygium grande]|nr:hypothetical protein NL676_025683 [Syzygium grande]